MQRRKGRTLVIVVLGALVLLTGAIFWIGATGGGGSQGGVSPSRSLRAGSGSPSGARGRDPDGPTDAGPLQETIADRKLREEMRRRLLEAWAKSPDEKVAAAARDGRFVPMPSDADGRVDPAYIRQVVREDFFPLVQKCYEELLSRKKDAGGRVEVAFKIVGDPSIGGIVEEADVTADGGLADERLTTCMRESMLSIAFRPPPKGWVTVVYPFVLSPDEDEPDAAGKR